MTSTTLLNTLAGAVDPTLGLLIEATLKGSVVLVVAACVGLALQAGSAARRHLLWTCALAALLVLPMLLAALPAWRVETPAPTWLAATAKPNPASIETQVTASEGAATASRRIPNADASRAAADADHPTAPAVKGATPPAAPASGGVPAPRASWRLLVVVAWAVGALLVFGAFVLGHVRLRLAARTARPLRDRAWHETALEAAEQLRLTLPFALLQSDMCGIPIAFGLLRPRVLLPAGAEQWPAARRRSVLLHELAHVQRYDCLTQALAQATCALFWFHPGVWWAAGKMRSERERACDDRVLAAATPASAYADHLLDVVRALRESSVTALGAVAFARPSQFEGRLLAVLDPHRDRDGVRPRQVVPSMAAAAAVLLVMAALQPAFDATPAAAQAHRAADRQPAPVTSQHQLSLVDVPQQGTLPQRLDWVEQHADRGNGAHWWIGWKLAPGAHLHGGILSDSEGIDFEDLEREDGRLTLADLLERRDTSTWDPQRTHGEGPMAALVQMGSAHRGAIERLRIQSTAFVPPDDGGANLYWLGEVPDAESFAWFKEAAERTEPRHLRAELVEAVSYHGGSQLVVPYLSDVLQRREPNEVRASAAEGLSNHPGPIALDLLVKTARTDRSTDVRRRAAESLGRMRSPEAMEQLVALAGDSSSNPDVRRGAFDAIGQEIAQRAPGVPAEQSEDSDGDPGKSPGSAVGEAWSSSDEPEPGEPSVELDPAELEVQLQAVESLGRFPVEAALPRLRALVDEHPNATVRGQAAEAIARLEGDAARQALEDIIWKSAYEQARMRAIEGMSRHAQPAEALAELQRIARTHSSQETRRMALEMMGRLDSEQSESALEDVLAHSNEPEMCRQAVESLGRRSGPQITSRLDEIARTHPVLEARRQAVESMARRDPEEAAPRLEALLRSDVPEEVQRQAVESLGRLDQDVMPALAELARSHPSPEVRRQAVETMARRDPDRALPILDEILRHPKQGK